MRLRSWIRHGSMGTNASSWTFVRVQLFTVLIPPRVNTTSLPAMAGHLQARPGRCNLVATLHCGAGAKRELPTLGPWPKTGCGGIKERTDRFHLVTRALERDVLPLWGQRNIADLGRRDILDLIDGIVDRGSPIMARRVHAYLHRLFRWSVGRGILAVNPMTDLPKPGSENRRDQVLSDKELVAVWRGAEQLGWPYGPRIQLLILTGARCEEISALRWSEVDLELAQIALKGDRTKSGEGHFIPLSPPAWRASRHASLASARPTAGNVPRLMRRRRPPTR